MVIRKSEWMPRLEGDDSGDHPAAQSLPFERVRILWSRQLIGKIGDETLRANEILRPITLLGIVLIADGLAAVGAARSEGVSGQIARERIGSLKLQAVAETLVESHEQGVVPVGARR